MASNDMLADFLEREQKDLASLNDVGFDETEGFNVPEPQGNDFFSPDPLVAEFGGDVTSDVGLGVVDGFAEPVPTQNIPVAPVVPRQEPEKIKRWREEQKVRLEKKDAEEEKEKTKLREQAKKELEDWYKNRAEQLEKTKKHNRVSEQEFIKERDADQPGQEWERITRLCEFNPKAAKNNKDVSRMRSILLQLKQQPIVKAT